VSATFDRVRQTYQLDVVVDPDALLTRLQIRATGDVDQPRDRKERDRRIAALCDAFLQSVRVTFDGVPSAPRFEYRASSAFSDIAQAPSVVRLAGTIPAEASSFAFGYELASGTFALVARIGDSGAQTVWLEGGHDSAALSVVAPPPPLTLTEVALKYFSLGFTHILPKGLDHILFVVGLFLLSTRWRSVLVQVSTFTLAVDCLRGDRKRGDRGVEVVAIAFFLVAYWRRNAISYRRLIAQPASIAIALAGLYWTIQRLL